jgi:hypothetical protein
LVDVHVHVRRAPDVAEEGDAHSRAFQQLLKAGVGADDVAVRTAGRERGDPRLSTARLLDPVDRLLGAEELELTNQPVGVLGSQDPLARLRAPPTAYPSVSRLRPRHPLVNAEHAGVRKDPGDLDRAGAVGVCPEDQP